MIVANIRDLSERMSFTDAVRQGAGGNGGLFMPIDWPCWEDLPDLLSLPLRDLWQEVFLRLFVEEIPAVELRVMVDAAFSFPLPIQQVSDRVWALELYHGPTLAFKDFGARFLAQVLAWKCRQTPERGPLTILTATSGDTGAAVAHAFHGLPGIEVIILYPAGRISPSQEKMFATLGGNIHSLRVAGAFDDCQSLVKECFADPELSRGFGLTSANSINIGRLLSQISYYLGGIALWLREARGLGQPVVCVPCGNFGNLTAGLLAWRLGLPVKRFLVATNRNDVVPEFLAGSPYRARSSVATPANAMDVGAPNNWERIEWLFRRNELAIRATLQGDCVPDDDILAAMRELHAAGYLADPHGAVAWRVLERHLGADEVGMFLETAHPGKFPEVVEQALGIRIPVPEALAQAVAKPVLARDIPVAREAVVQALEDWVPA